MADSSANRNQVERLAEEFLERQRRGERPSVSEYVGRHPEWAAEIRELFPALMVIERLKPEAGEFTGTFVGGRRPNLGGSPSAWGTSGFSAKSGAAGWESCTRRSRSRSAATSR